MTTPFGPKRHLPSGLMIALLFLLAAPLLAQPEARPMVGRNVLHTVKQGESMFTIARKYGLAVDHLAFANGYSPVSVLVEPGETLVVPLQRVLPANPPRNGLVLNLPERGLYFFRNGNFDRFIPVSIGDENGYQTPTGNFHIIERIANPTWYPPAWAKEKKPVGPGPDNPLGKHWIGLSLTRTGIHGTNSPLNIGNSVTHGCIRAYPDLVARLFNEVKVGWPVRIEYETVKVGKDPQGHLKLVTFPDIYKKQDPMQAVSKTLGDRVASDLSPLVGLELGIAMRLDRSQPLMSELKQEALRR